jgi:hypothetical protein
MQESGGMLSDKAETPMLTSLRGNAQQPSCDGDAVASAASASMPHLPARPARIVSVTKQASEQAADPGSTAVTAQPKQQPPQPQEQPSANGSDSAGSETAHANGTAMRLPNGSATGAVTGANGTTADAAAAVAVPRAAGAGPRLPSLQGRSAPTPNNGLADSTPPASERPGTGAAANATSSPAALASTTGGGSSGGGGASAMPLLPKRASAQSTGAGALPGVIDPDDPPATQRVRQQVCSPAHPLVPS